MGSRSDERDTCNVACGLLPVFTNVFYYIALGCQYLSLLVITIIMSML